MKLQIYKENAPAWLKCGACPFPVQPGEKHPVLKNWTTIQPDIDDWIRRYPDYNIGIRTGDTVTIDGKELRLFILDLDVKRPPANGIDFMKGWEVINGALPKTLCWKTPSGGRQYAYLTDKTGISNHSPVQSDTGVGSGVDVQADGKFAMVPPSYTSIGKYEFITHDNIAIADEQVYRFIDAVRKRNNDQATRGDSGDMTDVERVVNTLENRTALEALAYIPCEKVSRATWIHIGMALKNIGESVETWRAWSQKDTARFKEGECEEKWAGLNGNWNAGTIIKTAKQYGFNSSVAQSVNSNQSIYEKLQKLRLGENPNYGMNDAGAARLFMDVCGDRVTYIQDRKKWAFYDGQKWDAEKNAGVMEMLKEMAKSIYSYVCREIQDENRKAEMLKYYAKWQQLRVRETIMKDAQTIKPSLSSDFDQDPYILNCQNVILDLRTGQTKPHCGDAMLSQIAKVIYDPSARCDRWEQFIREVTNNDDETGRYLQKVLGYSLTGDTRRDCMFIIYGKGTRNGKGTFCRVFSDLMGDYAKSADPLILAKKQIVNSSGPSEEIVRLRDARYVFLSEPDKQIQLDAGKLKTYTGKGTITARGLHENTIQFVPKFKLFLDTNYLPQIGDLTLFKSGRFRIIPFDVHFTEDKRDPNLYEELTKPKSLSGILNWCIKGYQDYQQAKQHSLPVSVQNAIADYERSEDIIKRFLFEKTEKQNDFEVSSVDFHSTFSAWCMTNGYRGMDYRPFIQALRNNGIEPKKKRPKDSKQSQGPISMITGYRIRQEY